jgi:acetolactate synthase I/II/III large subunit
VTSAGEALVAACVAGGVTTAFTVPGESFLTVLDALHGNQAIRTVATRHEGGASFMAEASGKLRGRPALLLATRAVGAANLAIGVHTAMQDSAPMVVVLGQVSRRWRHRESFQETELAEMFRPLAKWTAEITDPARTGELTSEAISVATSGRPGPVVLSVPEDVLRQDAPLAPRPGLAPAAPAAAPESVAAILAAIAAARRPAMLLGGGALGSSRTAVALAARLELPVFASWRRPDVFPNEHRLYLGQTGFSAPRCVEERLLAADFLLVVGCRLSEVASFGYRVPAPGTAWAHVDIDPSVLARSASAVIRVQADAGAFLDGLLARASADASAGAGADADSGANASTDRDDGPLARRAAGNAADRARWERETTPVPAPDGPYADREGIAAALRELLPPDAITTVDAGNFSGWIARYLRWSRPYSFLGPTSGAMGYAVPAAIGARLHEPDRPVIAFAGDGGFLMTGAEIETAVREDAPVVTIVFDNQQYGTIRMHQELRFPGRPSATGLGPVDFVGFTRSLGGDGAMIERAAEFGDALKTAMASPRPYTIAVRTDPAIVSVDTVRLVSTVR